MSGCGSTYIVDKHPTNIHIFGNSVMAWNSHGIGKEIGELYNWNGADVTINDYSFTGATVEQIRNQWVRAEGNLDVVILEGGLNNVFLNAWWCWTPEGKILNEKCKDVVNAGLLEMHKLMHDIKKAGASRIALVVPYHVRGLASAFNPALDYSMPLWQYLCTEEWCSLVELANWICPEDESLYFMDGVHPSSKGSRRIARAIYTTLPFRED